MEFLTLPLTKQKNKRKEQKYNPISKSLFLKLLKNCHYLH